MKKVLFTVLIILLLTACQKPAETSTPTQQVAATVNGKDIYQSEVDQFVTALQSQGQTINNSLALDSIILRTLLAQESQKKNITITNEQVEQFLETELAAQNASLEDFKQMAGTQYPDMLNIYKEQLLLQELARSTANITVSDEEAEAFYEQNQAQLGNQTYKQLSGQIKTSLEQQKIQQVLSQIALKTQSQANITYN